jgi:hypothetical protein
MTPRIISLLGNAFLGLACLGLMAFSGCQKHETAQAITDDNQKTAAAPPDVCALLTKEEIETVVGSPIKETKSSSNADAGLRTSQCFYTAAEFAKSVSLAMTQRDGSAAGNRGPKQFWEDTFGHYDSDGKEGRSEDGKDQDADKTKRESLREQKRSEGEEEERTPPKKITGVGDEAFWSGNRVGGALYVLRKDAFIRVSVGGADKEDAKIEKCKALAQKAINRL